MPDLPDDSELLKVIIKALWEKLERLEAENAELRRRLGLDSTNSYKPPSSDGYHKKTVTPGLPKEQGRRNGGQAGHPGRTLRPVTDPDRLEVHRPGQCQCCDGPLRQTNPMRSCNVDRSLTGPNRSLKSPSIHSDQSPVVASRNAETTQRV